MFKDYHTFFSFSGVNQITIKNSIAAKKDIDVQITKLLKKNTEKGAVIAYETNVTDILEITTNKFLLSSSNLEGS